MRKLIVSSSNKGKIKEIKELLSGLDLEILSKNEAGLEDIHIIEDGDSLLANSRKKAMELAKLTDAIVLADDSGIFVEYLGGAPGVYSARYSGEDGNDKANNLKLLKALEGLEKKDRTAAFKTVISLVMEDKTTYEIEGVCKGHIDSQELGENGFGYDPLFIPDGYQISFGVLEDQVKNKISHRALAMEKLRKLLEEIL